MVLAKAEEAQGRQARTLPHRQPRVPQHLRLRHHPLPAIHQQHPLQTGLRPHEAQDVDVDLVLQANRALLPQPSADRLHPLHQLLQAQGNRLLRNRVNQRLLAPKAGLDELVDEAARGLLHREATE